MSSKVKTGVCKWFDSAKGYGFIIADGEPGDILVHYSRIEGTGYRNLVEGQRVRFTEETSPKGRMATWVTDSPLNTLVKSPLDSNETLVCENVVQTGKPAVDFGP